MASPGVDAIKGLLQGLEHTLGALDAASAAATQLITAQRNGKPLAPSVLQHYEQQFETRPPARDHGTHVLALFGERLWRMDTDASPEQDRERQKTLRVREG